jgi:hypothetical protein
MITIMNIKLNNTRINPNIRFTNLSVVCRKKLKDLFKRKNIMTMSTKSMLGHLPAPAAVAAPASSTKTLATFLLAAGVAGLVVMADQLIDDWAETHVIASWLALWAVAVLAIGALRGVSRLFAQKMMATLDGWSARVARRRADERLWTMAQSDERLMHDLQTAMDRADVTQTASLDMSTLMDRRAARIVRNRLYYI